ncbi:MAG: hypothetical protein WBB31_14210 [Saprospiraceae bacterium]
MLILNIYPTICKSQENITNPNCHFIFHLPEDTILSWNETIIPGTISWDYNNTPITIDYKLVENKIIPNWNKLSIPLDSIRVNFRALPYSFHPLLSLWDSSQIKIVDGDVFYNPNAIYPGRSLFESPGLDYNGALTRGFSLGNNQSLVFDSELNLQLNGNIGDGYLIKAAITDRNLPIQPDGTTRQIQEFDKVFIEIDKDQHSVLAGDFDALNPEGYFMRYNRKLKGVEYSYDGNKFHEPWTIKGSAAVSKGKFTRQTLVPTEGNQGPYPLKGENGELFIIVLAGSEKVFIDGALQTRGEDADYIMDYNKSEITFTRRILINVRHRITIEFEYAQFNFQKSQNAIEIRYQKDNLTSYMNFFQENDSKTITGDLQLTTEDLALLNMAGDAGSQFQKSGIKKLNEGYNPNLILYSAIDTAVNSVVYPDVLIWSTDPQKANLIVSFSEVGQGNGDYMISPDPSPNGRIYIWISPDAVTGDRRGNFAPIIPLQAPQQKQMITTGGEYQWNKNGKLSAEFGVSRHDLNRYSSIDDNDNAGGAMKVTLSELFAFGKSWTISPLVSYEENGINFRPLDPYRNPEFARDWSLSQNIGPGREQLPSVRIGVRKGTSIISEYSYAGLYRSGGYVGNKHNAQIKIDTIGWKFSAIIGILNAKDNVNKSRFLRPSINLERVIRKTGDWRLGIKYFEDRNEVRNVSNQGLALNSFIQNQMSFYINNSIDDNTHFVISYKIEQPKIPFQNQLKSLEKAKEWNIEGHFHQWKHFKMEYTIKNRNVQSLLSTPEHRSRNLLGRIDLVADVFKKAIRWSSGYEIGNGQEPKTEYKYIKVQKGEGNYIWVDNGNGIEEINEFEIAPFADQGEYIRVLAYNSEFISTRALGLQQSLNIDMKQIKPAGWVSKIALVSTYQMNRKIREDENSPYWNPFFQQYADTSILSFSNTWRNILYWNRSSTIYDIQTGYIRQQNQVLQTSGFEIREIQDLTFRWRLSLRKKMDIVIVARKGMRGNRSQYFAERNFNLSQYDISSELNAIIKERFRLTGLYQFLSQENITGNERFNSHKLSVESVWRRSNSSDIRGQVSLVEINYSSSGHSAVDFAILQGLQNGSNLLWSLQFNTRLNESLILTLQYNGRNTGGTKTIHTGNAQIRANF